MNKKDIRAILRETDHMRVSGTEDERRTAEYLRGLCAGMGAETRLEPFAVPMGDVRSASLTADGKDVPCRGFRCCGSGEVEAPLCYVPLVDKASLERVRGKVVLLDVGVTHFVFQDLYAAGAAGIITYDGNVRWADRDIDLKELRSFVACGKKLPCVNINAKDAFALVKNGVKTVRLCVEQEEYEGRSHNVIAELPGSTDRWIVLTAHYDTTPLSHGAYDNMSGCIGLLTILDKLRKTPHHFGLRFIFCGSEERGLLGSKAYTAAHADELDKVVLNVNLDMIGSWMGKLIACCSAEDALLDCIRYYAAEKGESVSVYQGVYSSDSTPFADAGVPAVSFARIAPPSQATIHNRYDTAEVLSAQRLLDDGALVAELVRRMADAAAFPVERSIPEKVRSDLDVYLNRKRKEQ